MSMRPYVHCSIIHCGQHMETTKVSFDKWLDKEDVAHIHYGIWGEPPKMEFIYKKLCLYSNMLKLLSPLKCSPFDAVHLSGHFFHCSKQFLNSLFLTPFSASAIFCFTSSTLAKCFALRTFFIQGNKKKSHLGQDQVNREGGTQGTCCFWSKTTEHSMWCGQVWS